MAVGADIGKVEDVERIAGVAEERFGRVDVLVNCAATRSMETNDPLAMTFEDWQEVLA